MKEYNLANTRKSTLDNFSKKIGDEIERCMDRAIEDGKYSATAYIGTGVMNKDQLFAVRNLVNTLKEAGFDAELKICGDRGPSYIDIYWDN